MRVLITGATTPLGISVVDQLRDDRGVDQILAVGLEPEAPPALVDGSRLSYASIDLRRPRSLHDLLWGPARKLGIDTVLHGAFHRSALAQGRRVHATNVEATRQLVLACERHPSVRRFVLRSAGEIYALRSTESNLIDEDAPLELGRAVPQWVADRVAADLTVCARMGMSRLSIAVLRCAEVLAAGTGSQLWDYLQSRVCLRPLGFDPMINVLSLEDHARAQVLALRSETQGVFNIPGADTLPLSRIIALAHRRDLPLPGPLLAPLYRLRARAIGLEFRYDLNVRRFHFGGVLDGTRARKLLGYRPTAPLWFDDPAATEPAEPPRPVRDPGPRA